MFCRHSAPVPLMSQHFLLSSAARTFSLMALCQLSHEDAYNMFRRLRWPDNDGAPVCPGCDCSVAYVYRCRRRHLLGGRAVFRLAEPLPAVEHHLRTVEGAPHCFRCDSFHFYPLSAPKVPRRRGSLRLISTNRH